MSEQIYFTPNEMAEIAAESAVKKAKMPVRRTLSLALLAGMYIGFGGLLVVLVGAGTAALPYGLVKLLMGLVFSIGLVLVVIGGAELFTGSTIVALAALDKKISWSKVLKNWSLVYLGNFIGALLLAALIILSKQYNFGGGLVSESIFKIAAGKLHYSFLAAVILGILCNIFVCLGVWLSYSSKSAGDKILAIIFPITAFVALGFEHSVANMYLLSSAWLIKMFDPAVAALYDTSSAITLYNIVVVNLIPVTIGNILGGLFIWVIYRFAYQK
ncbi:MAG: formate/nitrite transporter family protein [Patescibacteria group bacterium]